MWGSIILIIFIIIWMSLTFTDTLCDNEYVGMGLCFDPAWKTRRPVSFCPPCVAAASAPAPRPAAPSTSGYTAEPYSSY